MFILYLQRTCKGLVDGNSVVNFLNFSILSFLASFIMCSSVTTSKYMSCYLGDSFQSLTTNR